MHLLRGSSDSKLGRRAQRVCGPPAPCHGHQAPGEGGRRSPQPERSLLLPKQQVEAPTAREACRAPAGAWTLPWGPGRFLSLTASQCLPLARVADAAGCHRRGSPAGPAIPLRAQQGARHPPPHTLLATPDASADLASLTRAPAVVTCLLSVPRGGPAGCLSARTCDLSHRKRCARVILLNSSLSLTLVPPTAAPFSNVFHSYLPRRQEKYYL